ncbi:MAG: sulfurtransferase [Deltaproteobacteria bacterium]|nr:sulfurtransferase [Deltaproteobacteria bacterium]
MDSPPVITAAEAVSSRRGTIFLDARAGSGASEAYAKAHLPGALRIDLESDLSALADPATGGRHPLPPLERWLARLGDWGVTPSHQVIVYDDAGGGMAAARAWWMLRAISHPRVAVIDGGWRALGELGVPTEAGIACPSAVASYPRKVDRWPTVDAELVARVRSDPRWRLIDARAPERYVGATEPLDPVAGHIPGACNLYWQSQLDGSGLFDRVDALRARFAKILGDVPPEQVVCYCGSGVTACHLLLAMDACGLHGAKLYVGSWSEWCRQGRPLACD